MSIQYLTLHPRVADLIRTAIDSGNYPHAKYSQKVTLKEDPANCSYCYGGMVCELYHIDTGKGTWKTFDAAPPLERGESKSIFWALDCTEDYPGAAWIDIGLPYPVAYWMMHGKPAGDEVSWAYDWIGKVLLPKLNIDGKEWHFIFEASDECVPFIKILEAMIVDYGIASEDTDNG